MWCSHYKGAACLDNLGLSQWSGDVSLLLSLPCVEWWGETDNQATTPFGYCPSTTYNWATHSVGINARVVLLSAIINMAKRFSFLDLVSSHPALVIWLVCGLQWCRLALYRPYLVTGYNWLIYSLPKIQPCKRAICGNFFNKQINGDFRIVKILPKMEIWLGLDIRSYEPHWSLQCELSRPRLRFWLLVCCGLNYTALPCYVRCSLVWCVSQQFAKNVFGVLQSIKIREEGGTRQAAPEVPVPASVSSSQPAVSIFLQSFDASCCDMGTAVKHPVPARPG